MRFYPIEERKAMNERIEQLEQLERTGYAEIQERKILPRQVELSLLKELNKIYN